MKIMHQKGFTLIELLVTIAVMAILATLAVPAFGDMQTRNNLNRSSSELIGILNQARSKAVLERREITVDIRAEATNSLPANTATIFYWMPNGDAKLDGADTEIIFMLTGGVKGATADTDLIICDGRATADNPQARAISISKMGTIQQVVDGDC